MVCPLPQCPGKLGTVVSYIVGLNCGMMVHLARECERKVPSLAAGMGVRDEL